MPPIGGFATDTAGQANASGLMPEFAFVPQELTTHCRLLIEKYHKIHGYSHLPDMLWYADSRGFIQSHKELGKIFKKASMARGVRQANNSLLFVATIIMALEALVRDFAAWGARFPAARQQAEKLLGASPPSQRMWFMDTYLYALHDLDGNSSLRFAPRTDDARLL
jgi:hypothetical protein